MNFQGVKYVVNRRLLGRKSLLARTRYFDLQMQVMADDVIGRHLYKYAAHDSTNTDFLIDYLEFEDGDVALDIGANIGWFSLIIDRIAAGKQVDIFGFEPDPTNFHLFQQNISANGAANVRAQQCAVADVAGILQLHLYGSKNLGRHSLLDIHGGDTVDVETVILDDFWESQGLSERVPRFIKIDVEGFELMALRGAPKILARCPLVMMEYSPGFMKSASIDPAELLDLMYAHSLQPHRLEDGKLAGVTRDELVASERHVDLFWLKS